MIPRKGTSPSRRLQDVENTTEEVTQDSTDERQETMQQTGDERQETANNAIEASEQLLDGLQKRANKRHDNVNAEDLNDHVQRAGELGQDLGDDLSKALNISSTALAGRDADQSLQQLGDKLNDVVDQLENNLDEALLLLVGGVRRHAMAGLVDLLAAKVNLDLQNLKDIDIDANVTRGDGALVDVDDGVGNGVDKALIDYGVGVDMALVDVDDGVGNGVDKALVDVDVTPDTKLPGIRVTARVKVSGQTGVEMEALTAVSVACLTIYDMVKAVDRGMRIEGIRLVEKSGGRSGHFRARE